MVPKQSWARVIISAPPRYKKRVARMDYQQYVLILDLKNNKLLCRDTLSGA